MHMVVANVDEECITLRSLKLNKLQCILKTVASAKHSRCSAERRLTRNIVGLCGNIYVIFSE